MILKGLKTTNHLAISYTITNFGSKALAAIVQLYAILVFTKIHTQYEAALIFLLLGYSIWFQVFEFGLAQTLQNKFNARELTVSELLIMVLAHYLCMLFIAILVVSTPYLTNALLPQNRANLGGEGINAFSVGAAILLVASNNLVSQRLLLVFNKEQVGNVLIMIQSVLAILGLACYEFMGRPDLVIAVLLYLGPQVFVSLPVLLRWSFRALRKHTRMKASKFITTIYDAFGFLGLSVLATIFLGADYYFAAHYMSSQEVVSYHLATRLFFISFIAYYAFVQYSARRLSIYTLARETPAIEAILKGTLSIGFCSVITVYLISVFMEHQGFFNYITNGLGIGQWMLFSAFAYFMIRVCRDVCLVVMGGLNARGAIYKVYAIEVILGLSLMYLMVPRFGGYGLFASLALACFLSTALLLQQARKIGITLRL